MKKLLIGFLWIALACIGLAQPPPPLASQAQAVAGTNNFSYMSPLRVAQAMGGGGGAVSGTTGTFSSLTSGRVVFVSTGGLLADDARFVYNPATGTFRVNMTGNAAGIHQYYQNLNTGNAVDVRLRFEAGDGAVGYTYFTQFGSGHATQASKFQIASGGVQEFAPNSVVALTLATSGEATFASTVGITTSLTTPSTTFALLNTTATTLNAFGAATTVNLGASASGAVYNLGGAANAAELRFLEPSGSGTHYSALKAQAQGASITYTLPATVGAAGTALTDAAGNGTLSWAAAGTTLTSTQVGYGSGANAVTGEAAFAYNATSNILTVGGVSLGAGSEVSTIGPLVDAVDGVTPLNNINQVVAAGTAFTMTASYASLDFGTTDPILTIANAGTYAIYVDVQFNLVGATYATYDSVTVKLRRTNNTAADLTGSTFGTFIPTITTITAVGPYLHIGPIKYVTALTTDTITVQGILGSTPSVGSVTATAATITAIRAY